ncbi:MAG: hypothetical protein SGCHY_004873, partial [Lobulomycetales sp.]
MIQHKTICKVIDNSGALLVECINVLGTRGRIAKTGDEIVCVVKKAKNMDAAASSGPSSSAAGANASVAKLKKGQVARAVLVRAKFPTSRRDGSQVCFDDNAVVMINRAGQPLGNRVGGVIAS